jgi:hypothetical protein
MTHTSGFPARTLALAAALILAGTGTFALTTVQDLSASPGSSASVSSPRFGIGAYANGGYGTNSFTLVPCLTALIGHFPIELQAGYNDDTLDLAPSVDWLVLDGLASWTLDVQDPTATRSTTGRTAASSFCSRRTEESARKLRRDRIIHRAFPGLRSELVLVGVLCGFGCASPHLPLAQNPDTSDYLSANYAEAVYRRHGAARSQRPTHIHKPQRPRAER